MPLDRLAHTFPPLRTAMSSRPSPLKSPTSGVSPENMKVPVVYQFRLSTNAVPFDTATNTPPPGRKVATSSRPSPLKSPVRGISLPMLKKPFHSVALPRLPFPAFRPTKTLPSWEGFELRRKVTTSAKPSPLKSPTPGVSLARQKLEARFTAGPNDPG